MKVLFVTGSRADFSAIDMTREAVKTRHEVHELSLWNYLNVQDDISIHAQQAGHIMHQINGQCGAIPFGPDLAVVCGDRWEILAAATTLYILQVPIAHLSGGDVTEGSRDNKMRDAISMLSSLHFPTHHEAGDRLRSMGINPGAIFQVGSPAVDRILSAKHVSRETLFWGLLPPGAQNFIVSIHPETIGRPEATCVEVLKAVAEADRKDTCWYFTTPNADTGRTDVASKIKAFCAMNPDRMTLMGNLVPDRFIALMAHSRAIIGNSSVCAIDAPCAGLPSILVGDRQTGRPRIAWRHVPAEAKVITAAIRDVRTVGAVYPSTIYGDGRAALKIAEVLDGIDPIKLRQP